MPSSACKNSFRASCRDGRIPGARLPGGSAIFPLVIGELFDLCAVIAHEEDFAVGLRRAGVERFVFESHPRAGESKSLPIRRPGQMRFVAGSIGQLAQIFAVRANTKNFKISLNFADDSSQVASAY